MADVSQGYDNDDNGGLDSDYYQDQDQDEFGYESLSGTEPLGIDRLEQYLLSENSYTRQLLSGGLLEVLKNAGNVEERKSVFDALSRLAIDEEPNVRAELMDHIPSIVEYILNNKHEVDGLYKGISSSIVPSILRRLHDSDSNVRKVAQNSLIIILDHRAVSEGDISGLICPSILELLLPDSMSEEYRTEAVTLMVRISPLLPVTLVEEHFLPKFCDLCSEHLFHIRKACATNFGEMCRVVGPELAEYWLLPKFYTLCEDGIWGVRRACTECFMEVSNTLTQEARKNQLSKLYVSLLCDQSRWVRMSAFQALGPFISTFADANSTGLYYDADGVIKVQPLPDIVQDTAQRAGTDNSEHRSVDNLNGGEYAGLDLRTDKSRTHEHQSGLILNTADTIHTSNIENTQPPAEPVNSSAINQSDDGEAMDLSNDLISPSNSGDSTENVLSEQINLTVTTCNDTDKSVEEIRSESYRTDRGVQLERPHIHNETEDYSSFNYWRQPPPQIDINSLLNEVSQPENTQPAETIPSSDMDQSLEDNVLTDISTITQSLNNKISLTNMCSSTAYMERTERDRNISTTSSTDSDFINYSHVSIQQDIIPAALLENYLSMCEPTRAQTVDTEIAQHCAYSLPAVAYTLGRKNWKCLKILYENLCSDMQWKVRRTLAYSIHELAVILGTELTENDLVPIFNGFIRDLDEVRTGVLVHLSDFIKLLNLEKRRCYLSKLEEFINMENRRVWRTRYDLTLQLVELCSLYDTSDVYTYIVPLALQLITDEIAQVRHISIQLISRIMMCLQSCNEAQHRLMLVNDLIERLAHSNKWHTRQIYVYMCCKLIEENSITLDQFAKELLPSILTLSSDKTANVRIAVAKLISQCLLPLEYFTSSKNPHHDEMVKVEMTLRTDSDRDVRHFVTLAPQVINIHHSTVEV